MNLDDLSQWNQQINNVNNNPQNPWIFNQNNQQVQQNNLQNQQNFQQVQQQNIWQQVNPQNLQQNNNIGQKNTFENISQQNMYPSWNPQNFKQPYPTNQIKVEVNTSEKKNIDNKKCKSFWFFKNIILFTIMILWFLILMDKNNILNWYFQGIDLWYIFYSLVLVWVVLMFSYRKLLWKIFWLLFFITIVWWLSFFWIYNSFFSKIENNKDVKFFINSWHNANFKLETSIWTLNIFDIKDDFLLSWKIISDRFVHYDTWISGDIPYLNIVEDSRFDVLKRIDSKINLWLNSDVLFNSIYLKWLYLFSNLDLSKIQFNNLEINNWYWKVNLIIWNNFEKTWSIILKWAYLDLNTIFPEKIWIQLKCKYLLWSVETSWLKKISKDLYETESFNSAEKKLYIDVNALYLKLK